VVDTIDIDDITNAGDVILSIGAAAPQSGQPSTIDVTALNVGDLQITPLQQYRIQRDTRITWLAIAVIGGTALMAILMLMRTEYHAAGSVTREHWAIELLNLTLVSSLSFVMGMNTSNSSSG